MGAITDDSTLGFCAPADWSLSAAAARTAILLPAGGHHRAELWADIGCFEPGAFQAGAVWHGKKRFAKLSDFFAGLSERLAHGDSFTPEELWVRHGWTAHALDQSLFPAPPHLVAFERQKQAARAE